VSPVAIVFFQDSPQLPTQPIERQRGHEDAKLPELTPDEKDPNGIRIFPSVLSAPIEIQRAGPVTHFFAQS